MQYIILPANSTNSGSKNLGKMLLLCNSIQEFNDYNTNQPEIMSYIGLIGSA